MVIKLVLSVSMALTLCGCEVLNHVTCAPRSLVEGCLLEAYPASGEGWGPQCGALNEFAKLNGLLYGGSVAAPPHPVPPVPPGSFPNPQPNLPPTTEPPKPK